MILPLLVKNMGDPKNPWDDIPIEIIIEEERKRAEELERQRPRIYVPTPDDYNRYPPTHRPETEDDDEEEESIIVIKLI
jgi:hypothetical protein